MKFYIILSLKIIFLINHLYSDLEKIEGDDVDICESNSETLFVSLGSYCAPASLIRSCGHRKAAFPFDWNITLDGEKLIEILNDNFLNFLNDEYLLPYNWGALLNVYYHIEFVHDGFWDEENYSIYMPILQSKYKRRIERFQNLKEYKGKVFFIRSAYIHSLIDKNRFYTIKENIEITEDYASRLYNTLKNFFPKLDFKLIIINNHQKNKIELEQTISDALFMIRAHSAFETPIMQDAYEVFFKTLLQKNNL